MNKKITPLLVVALIVLFQTVSAQKKYTVSGYVTDEKTSETAIGATIYEQSTHQGTITNVFGFYSITLAEGVHELSFS